MKTDLKLQFTSYNLRELDESWPKVTIYICQFTIYNFSLATKNPIALQLLVKILNFYYIFWYIIEKQEILIWAPYKFK